MKKLLSVKLVIFVFLWLPQFWHPSIALGTSSSIGTPASWLCGAGSGGILDGCSGLDFIKEKLVPLIISILLFLVIGSGLVFSMVGGIMMMASSGNKEAMAKAKATITHAIAGMVLGLLSFAILKILSSFFQIDLLIL